MSGSAQKKKRAAAEERARVAEESALAEERARVAAKQAKTARRAAAKADAAAVEAAADSMPAARRGARVRKASAPFGELASASDDEVEGAEASGSTLQAPESQAEKERRQEDEMAALTAELAELQAALAPAPAEDAMDRKLAALRAELVEMRAVVLERRAAAPRAAAAQRAGFSPLGYETPAVGAAAEPGARRRESLPSPYGAAGEEGDAAGMSEADKDKFQLYVMNSGKWPRWLLPGSTQAELVACAKRLLAEATTFDDQAHGFCGQVAAKAAGSGMLGTGGLSLEDLQPEKAAEVLAAKRRMVQEEDLAETALGFSAFVGAQQRAGAAARRPITEKSALLLATAAYARFLQAFLPNAADASGAVAQAGPIACALCEQASGRFTPQAAATLINGALCEWATAARRAVTVGAYNESFPTLKLAKIWEGCKMQLLFLPPPAQLSGGGGGGYRGKNVTAGTAATAAAVKANTSGSGGVTYVNGDNEKDGECWQWKRSGVCRKAQGTCRFRHPPRGAVDAAAAGGAGSTSS